MMEPARVSCVSSSRPVRLSCDAAGAGACSSRRRRAGLVSGAAPGLASSLAGGPVGRVLSSPASKVDGAVAARPSSGRSAAADEGGGGASAPSLPASRASPKSMTRTRPSWPTMTLSGLKSRCTRPARCAAASPSPAARNTCTMAAAARGFALSHWRSVWPSMSSVAMNTSPPSSPTSKTVSTLVCDRRAKACASRRRRSRKTWAAAPLPAVFSTLSATWRSSSGS